MKSDKPTPEGRKAERVLRKAVARIIEENRKLGLPVAVMKAGKAVLVSADKAMSMVRESHGAYSAKTRK